MKLAIYDENITCVTRSVISGNHTEKVNFQKLPDIAVLNAFLDDDDLQQMTITSTNIGFTRTFTKNYRKTK